ncbi:MAG: tetratricopeptide repeat protein [Bacteroidales bacterium]|nr:tetratricopeptide repeat protein [Bacteroidales bacterium]
MARYFIKSIRIITLALLCISTLPIQASRENKTVNDSIEAQQIAKTIDSLFYNEDYSQALTAIANSYPTLTKLNNKHAINRVIMRRAWILRLRGEYGAALTDLNMILENQREAKDTNGIASTLNHIGAVYRLRGDYATALNYYFKSLSLYQTIGVKSGVSHQLNNIGVVYLYQKLYDKALEYYLQSLKIEEELKDDEGIGISYLNIGEAFRKKGELRKATDYYLKALMYAHKNNDLDAIGTIHNEIAGINTEQGLINEVLPHLYKAKESFHKLGNKSRIAEYEMNHGNFGMATHQYSMAIAHYTNALKLSDQTGAMEIASNANKQLSLVYEKTNNIAQAHKHYKAHIALRDSLFNEENTRKSVQSEMIYQFEQQQEKANLEQIKKEAVFAERIHRQKMIRNFLLIIVLLFSGLVLAILYALVKIRRINNNLELHQKEILAKNEELQQQREEILTQRDEIERKNLYLEQAQQIVAEKNIRMISSIEYAKTIQQALLPKNEDLQKLFKDHFVIYLPKDIVSGDFYWISSNKQYTHIAIMDCTGHGVPGSFMALIGNTLLNQIVNEWQIRNPSLVLETLNEQLRKALKQDEYDTKLHASIDIGFISIDFQRKKLLYAGANRPLIIVKDGNLEKIAGNTRSAGGFQPKAPKHFVNNERTLESTSILYLTTDGYSDQMNPVSKKFGQQRLYNLLMQISDKEMSAQKTILLNELANHKGGEDQLDDICILGIKL